MPEGDTIFRAARTLNRALAGHIVTGFESVLPKLTRIHEDAPVTGRTIVGVTAHGKWMVMEFSGDLFLLTHMRMNGSWHIYRPGEAWKRSRFHMRVAISTAEFLAVGFDVPVAEFHTGASLARHPEFSRLGEDVLGVDFDEQTAVAQLQSRPDLEVAEALLLQSLLAGIGNVFKSEICFACGVNPFRLIASLTQDELLCLVRTARKYMLANVGAGEAGGGPIVTYTGFRRTTGRSNPSDRLWVYQRRGAPCRRCGTAVESRKQGPGARVTFWCPQCQPAS